MAALVQTIPQQSDLQSRPSSSSGSFPSSQPLHPAGAMSWHSFQTNTGSGGYRGGHPVAPYALPSPNLSPSSQSRQSRPHHLKAENRTTSAPSVPQGAPGVHTGFHTRYNYPISSSSNSSFQSYRSKDDTAIPSRQPRSDHTRPLSTANLPSPASLGNLSSKPFPDRYRRGVRRDGPSPTIGDDLSSPASLKSPLSSMPQNRAHTRVSSADGARQERPQPDLAKRYRRRSVGNIDTNAPIHLPLNLPSSSLSSGSHDYFDSNPRPSSSHSRKDSGSNHSAHSSTSSVCRSLIDVLCINV